MAHREYAHPLVNGIAYIIQLLITAIAYILNFLLLFIILRCCRKDIGSYRVLLTFFAVSDLYYNTLHFTVYPIPEMYVNAFIMGGHGMYPEHFGVALYLGAYGHAFPILIFHFLYRLLTIKYPQFVNYFPYFFLALVVSTAMSNAVMFTIFYWFFHPDEESIRVLTPLFNGSFPHSVVHSMDTAQKHAHALYWAGDTFEQPRWRNITGVGLMFSTMAATYVFIVWCSLLINKYLKFQTKSPQSIRMQKQLFRSLIYQAFVPLFTAYYPAGTSVMLPILGITIPHISILVPPACATHPLVDPLVLMLSINEFRRSFFRIIGLSKLNEFRRKSSSIETTNALFTRVVFISSRVR